MQNSSSLIESGRRFSPELLNLPEWKKLAHSCPSLQIRWTYEEKSFLIFKWQRKKYFTIAAVEEEYGYAALVLLELKKKYSFKRSRE